MFTRLRPAGAVVIAAGLLVAAGAGAATAAKLIDSSDVKDGSLRSVDIRDDNLTGDDVKDQSLQYRDFSESARDRLQGQDGKNGKDATYVGPNWSIVDRNVIGNGDSYLRSGPGTVPSGVGSLGLRTGAPGDKAAFGNEIDFKGMSVNDLTQVGFSVFTTGENASTAPNNMPSIAFEIDPNLDAFPTKNFSTMVYVPDNGTPNGWTAFDAVSDPVAHWGLTGLPGTPCDINGSRCTFTQLMDYLDDGAPDATIYTAQITKGRDHAFSGAVDDLVINDTTYDFEPFGVYEHQN